MNFLARFSHSSIFADMSLPAEYLDLLVHPVYKTPLKYDVNINQLRDDEHNDLFAIKENVPVLLTNILDAALSTTDQNKQAGTVFQYKLHYQTDAEVYDYFENINNEAERVEIDRLRQTIVSQIPPSAKWILDVGCGGGWLAKAIVPKGFHVISMDISDVNPIKATKRVASAHHFGLVADVFELPVKPDSIDCIIASEIIEHVSDPKKFLEALFAVLKPGGKIIVTTPYNELIRTSLCIHCNKETPHNAHLHSFTEESMKKSLPHGTRKVSMKVFNSKLLVRTQVQKLLKSLPLTVWNYFDKLGNTLTGKKAFRLMVVIEK